MNNKAKKLIIFIICISIFCIIGIAGFNRILFGVWNVFDLPDRINIYGRRYYIAKLVPKDTVENQDQLQFIEWPRNLTLKKLYMDPVSIIVDVPTKIYIKSSNGKYQPYSLSGF